MGCVASYTESVIGGTVIIATPGVRQGSDKSCLLFIVNMNEFIRMLKCSCEFDGFLDLLHTLMLMDDTVLLRTAREGMINKATNLFLLFVFSAVIMELLSMH